MQKKCTCPRPKENIKEWSGEIFQKRKKSGGKSRKRTAPGKFTVAVGSHPRFRGRRNQVEKGGNGTKGEGRKKMSQMKITLTTKNKLHQKGDVRGTLTEKRESADLGGERK